MVWYFIGVYIINRTLHGRLEIQNFSLSVEKYFTSEHSKRVKYFQHKKRNFVSPSGHVISSINFIIIIIITIISRVDVLVLIPQCTQIILGNARQISLMPFFNSWCINYQILVHKWGPKQGFRCCFVGFNLIQLLQNLQV